MDRSNIELKVFNDGSSQRSSFLYLQANQELNSLEIVHKAGTFELVSDTFTGKIKSKITSVK